MIRVLYTPFRRIETLSKVTILGLLISPLLSGCRLSSGDSEGLKQQLASALPIHSSSTQVIEYLNAHKIGHSPYHRDTTWGNTIEAEISVKSTRDLVDPSYDVNFRFDEHGLLTAYDVQYLGYVGL